MKGTRRGGTAATPASPGASPRRWRPLVAAATALAAISLAVPLATALATAAAAAPVPPRDMAPSGVVMGAARYIFFNGGDGSVWRKTVWLTAAAPGATPLGGRIVGGPSAVRLGRTQTMLVFGQGTDGALWVTSCAAKRCGGTWTSLGGRLTSKPGAADVNASRYSVYARGADGAVWARDHTAKKGWGPWHSIGGKVLAGTGPGAAYRSGPFVLVTGTNGELYMAHAGRTGFGKFEGFGGKTTASPALVNTAGALVGFARGTDGAGYYHRFMPRSPGWHSMGAGILASGVGAAASGSSTWTYAIGSDGNVYENLGLWGYPPTFSGWGPRTP